MLSASLPISNAIRSVSIQADPSSGAVSQAGTRSREFVEPTIVQLFAIHHKA